MIEEKALYCPSFLVEGLRDGSITEIRRVIKTPGENLLYQVPQPGKKNKRCYWFMTQDENNPEKEPYLNAVRPTYTFGSILIVHEICRILIYDSKTVTLEYREGREVLTLPNVNPEVTDKIVVKYGIRNWLHPKIMPKEFARTRCKVVDIYPERIQDISDESIAASGIHKISLGDEELWVHGTEVILPDNSTKVDTKLPSQESARDYFASVWTDYYLLSTERADYKWMKNPWVWVAKVENVNN